jgi:Domain of unknown function (DUF1854)
MKPEASIQLAYDAFGRLQLTLPEGCSHVGVVPVRCFPFTDPTRWISFCDTTGHEVHCLADMARLPAETRTLLESDLARREFVPVIRQIHSVSPGAEPTEWDVVTDRGKTNFKLTSEDHIRRLGAQAAIVTDAHGVRYLIPSLESLDVVSRRILRRYL